MEKEGRLFVLIRCTMLCSQISKINQDHCYKNKSWN